MRKSRKHLHQFDNTFAANTNTTKYRNVLQVSQRSMEVSPGDTKRHEPDWDALVLRCVSLDQLTANTRFMFNRPISFSFRLVKEKDFRKLKGARQSRAVASASCRCSAELILYPCEQVSRQSLWRSDVFLHARAETSGPHVSTERDGRRGGSGVTPVG